eukprot:CAMPEP_0184517164 /NCGR_PEP_ID=MMETSP0198_2-20121128/5414_1 /TAXON_ID=1112570 /ORGANISM="Thraustochytrium sp., Strain LLF1b" /LENGTH=42 /DNA_ID= /DNA_START= /DNA_END= /DNA_ORIENTATION=
MARPQLNTRFATATGGDPPPHDRQQGLRLTDCVVQQHQAAVE